MTTTKIAYVIAVVVPFGFIILAGAFLLHTAWVRYKERQSATEPQFS